MGKKEEIKKLERRARAMLLSKEIPPHKQELVRALINNKQLDQKEKWRAVIELVRSCVDKEPVLYRERVAVEVARIIKPPVKKEVVKPATEAYAPTETSYYIDELYSKYRSLGLFRIRYLVHRNNRIGIGIKKRLVPTKKFLKLIEHVSRMQNLILSRIEAIMTEILMDESVAEPIVFNYLRLIRSWMAEFPLLNERYEKMKWMERNDFDGFFRIHVSAFFSFLKLDADTRERIMMAAESRLRSLGDPKNDEINGHQPDAGSREMDKGSFSREKSVFDYLSALRSFLPADAQQECILSKQLEKRFAVNNYAGLLLMIQEALVFQRPIKPEEMIAYYGINAPSVSVNNWDCNNELLIKAGKDEESIKRKKLESLKKELEPYETLSMLLKLENGGQNILFKAFADQMRYVERKQHDPKTIYGGNYLYFLHGLTQYFKNMYLPLLDGSEVLFRDMGRGDHAGSMFSPAYFVGLLDGFKNLMEEMSAFRSGNHGYVVSKNEVKRFIKGELDLPEKVGRLIGSAGDFFYAIGHELQYWYESHKKWALSRSKPTYQESAYSSIMDRGLDAQDDKYRPLPYFNCAIKEVKNGNALMNEIIGKRMVEESLRDGVYVQLNAFAYQAAYECHNGSLLHDLDEMKSIKTKAEQG